MTSPPAANRLLAVQAAPQSHLPTRSYTYDANGNLLTDSHRYLQETTYGRADLPFQLVQDDPGPGRTISTYLYDANDQRIYARSGAEPAVDRCAYTLRDVDGSEVGVLDLARPWEEPPAEGDPGTCPEGWSWYLFGAHRLARITPDCDQQPALYTADLGRAAFAQGSEPYDLLLGFLQLQLAQPGGIQWPLLLRIVHLTDSTDLYLGDAHYEQLTAQDTALAALPVTRVQFEHEREWVVLTAPDKRQVEFSLEEMLGTAQQRSSGGVPFAYTAPANTALNQVTYYDHDHLGNTRLTYTPTRCQDLAPTDGVPEWALNIEHAVDYDPYGKVLRQYVNSGGQERYLTTQHERDQETGLDYRGARYYDSDVARFLSLDPLAADYASWSAYNYVLGDPIRLIDPDGKAPGCGCPTPPCGEVVQRLEAMYNVIADPIVQARNDAMKSIGEGFSALGDWLNGWAGDGGYTLTTTTRDAPPNNADRKGDPSGQINVDYLMDYQSASKLGPKKFSPTLPDPGPQTFVEGYNKLWKAGELLTGSGQSSQGGTPVRSDTSYSTAPTTGSFATPDGFFNGEWYNAGDTMSSDYPAGNPVRKWQARTNPSF